MRNQETAPTGDGSNSPNFHPSLNHAQENDEFSPVEIRRRTIQFVARVPKDNIALVRNIAKVTRLADDDPRVLTEVLWAVGCGLLYVLPTKLNGLDTDDLEANESVLDVELLKRGAIDFTLKPEETLKEHPIEPIVLMKIYLLRKAFMCFLVHGMTRKAYSIDDFVEAMRKNTNFCDAEDEFHRSQLEIMVLDCVMWALKAGYLEQKLEMVGPDWRTRHAQKVFYRTGEQISAFQIEDVDFVAMSLEGEEGRYEFSYTEEPEFSENGKFGKNSILADHLASYEAALREDDDEAEVR